MHSHEDDRIESTVGVGAVCSRRDALVLVGYGLAIGAASLILPGGIALATDSGGGGGEEGGGQGGGNSIANGHDFIWYDRGGFTDHGEFRPEQGWGETSVQWFWDNQIIPFMRNNSKLAERPAVYLDTERGNTGKTSKQLYESAAREAVSNALSRNHARGGTAENARVVGVGWTWTQHDSHSYWNFAVSLWAGQRTFSFLIERAGNNSELPARINNTSTGWGDKVDVPGHTDETWREYIYKQGKADNRGDDYLVVVVAVCDDEPKRSGFLKVRKQPSM